MYDKSTGWTERFGIGLWAGLILSLAAGCGPHRNQQTTADLTARAKAIVITNVLLDSDAPHFKERGRVKYDAIIITDDMAQKICRQELKNQAAQMNADLVVLDLQKTVEHNGQAYLEMVGRAFARVR